MIYVDDRTGSSDLFPMLRRLGLPSTMTRLTFGDISFIGNGPEDLPISVGIEVKSLKDILTCMTDGRFTGHQLPGMLQSYQQVWLLLQGSYRACPLTGILQQLKPNGQWYEATLGSRRFMWKDLETWLLSVQVKGGLNLHKCSGWNEGAQWIGTLYRWWTSKAYEDHRGHLGVHSSNLPLFDRAILVRPTLCRMVALQLPGIGVEKSGQVADYFGSVHNMVTADITDWEYINGIGRTIASRIYYKLRSDK